MCDLTLNYIKIDNLTGGIFVTEGPRGPVELEHQERLLIGAVFLSAIAYVGWVAYELLFSLF